MSPTTGNFILNILKVGDSGVIVSECVTECNEMNEHNESNERNDAWPDRWYHKLNKLYSCGDFFYTLQLTSADWYGYEIVVPVQFT